MTAALSPRRADADPRALGPGIHDAIAADIYHADPCAVPSLSASIAKVMLDQSPRHAWMKHPRLNPHFEKAQKRDFDIGSAAHALMLEGEEAFVLVEADSYRTKAAQEARDEAYAAGKTPLLARQIDEIHAMVRAARAQIARHEEASEAFDPRLGRPEQTMIWQEGDVTCRSRIDWLPASGNALFDYKTTTSAHPDDFTRRAYDLGHDVTAAFYLRGLHALTGREWRYRFVVQETSPPYALSVCEIEPASLGMAARKVSCAIDLWRWCLAHGAWPGYPSRVAYIQAPPWEEHRWIEREERELMLSDMGDDAREFLLNWQAPVEAREEPA